MKAKVVNGFVWLVVNKQAFDIYINNIFDLYILNDDGSESLVTKAEQIFLAIDNGLDIAVEVGHLNII
jgi:hypothetical protein